MNHESTIITEIKGGETVKPNELGAPRNPTNIAQAIMLVVKVGLEVFDAACHIAVQYKKTKEELSK